MILNREPCRPSISGRPIFSNKHYFYSLLAMWK